MPCGPPQRLATKEVILLGRPCPASRAIAWILLLRRRLLWHDKAMGYGELNSEGKQVEKLGMALGTVLSICGRAWR